MRHGSLCALFGVAFLVYCASLANADTIFQSANDGTNGGFTVGGSGNQILGVRFSVSNAVIVQTIGGDFTGSGTIFGAIIQLSGPTDFPDSFNPLNTADVLGHTLITLTQPTTPTDESSNIGPILLNPGEYAVIFGSNQFGATGAGAADGGTEIGSPSYFADNTGHGGNWFNEDLGTNFFVNGVPASTVAPLPAPAMGSLALLGITVVFAAYRRMRGSLDSTN